MNKRNRERTGQDPSYFYSWMNEGRRTLSYLSRNTLPDTKSSCPDAEFHSGICSTSSGISSGRIYLANSGRIYLASSSKFFDRIFVQGNFWISYRENPGYLTLSEGRSSDQQAEGRKSDLRLMFRNRFQSGIPYHDRRISYLGEYCGIATIRSSGLHSFKNKSNLDPDQFFPGFFHSWMNEGRKTLSYPSRNPTTWGLGRLINHYNS
jgi:hypothetical protein